MKLLHGMSQPFVLSVILALAATGAWGQTASPPNSVDGKTLQRLLQYEMLLGSQLSAPVSLCVDELMERAWILPVKPSAELSNATADKLRRATETCIVESSGQRTRLAKDLRAMLERQLKLAALTERPLSDSRTCVIKANSITELRECLSKAMDVSPNADSWNQWISLYERRLIP